MAKMHYDYEPKYVLENNEYRIGCKAEGCNNVISETATKTTYRGGRYRLFCSDKCRKAEQRRQQKLLTP